MANQSLPNTLMDAPDVLKKIAAYKVDEVAALRADCLLYTSPSPRD